MKRLLLLFSIGINQLKAGQFHEIECLEQKIIPIDNSNQTSLTKFITSSSVLSHLTEFSNTNNQKTQSTSVPIPLEKETVQFFLNNAEALSNKKKAKKVFENSSLKNTILFLAAADFLGHEVALKALESPTCWQYNSSAIPADYGELKKNIPLCTNPSIDQKSAQLFLVHNLPLFTHLWSKKAVEIKAVDPKPTWVAQKLEQSKKLRAELINDRKILKKNEDWHRYDALPGNKALVFGSIYGDAIVFEKKDNEPEYQVRAKEQRIPLNDVCFRDADTILMALDGKVVKWQPTKNRERILVQLKNEPVDRLTIHREKNIAATFHSELLSSARHVVLWQAKPWRLLSRIEINKFEGHAFELIFNDNCNQLYISVKGSNDYSHLIVDLSQQMAAYASFKQFLPNATLKDAFLLLYGLQSSSPRELLANNPHLAQDVNQTGQFVRDFYQIQQEDSFFYKVCFGLYNTLSSLFS